MADYKLSYFPVRGRGQSIRYLLTDNGVKFVEEVITGETWPSIKPKTAFGQVPMLVDGDVELVQSNAILRYLGRKLGLHPDDIKDSYKVDMVSDHVEDVRGAYVKLIYQNYDAGKEDYIKGIGAKLEPLEKLFKLWGNDFITKKISFADYNLFDLLEIHEVLSPGCLDAFPTLKAYYDRMANRPAIKAYRATEAFTSLPVNGNGKQ